MTRFAKTLFASAALVAFSAPAFAEPPVETEDQTTYSDGYTAETTPEGAVIVTEPNEDVAGEVETANDPYSFEDDADTSDVELDSEDDADDADDLDTLEDETTDEGETDSMWDTDASDEDPLD